MSEITLREGIALLLWLVGAVLVVGKLVISLRHAFRAVKDDSALASDIHAPQHYALTAMLAASLAVAGFLVWVPAVSYTHLDVYKRQARSPETVPSARPMLPAAPGRARCRRS